MAWLLLAACCALWFHALAARTLIPTDEGRYAEIAREMAKSGDFVTQRLNGIKYYGKPPLQSWMTALAFRAFGLGAWQARLWTGLCGLAGILLVTCTGMRLFGRRAGLLAGAVLASSLFWVVAGHISSLDMSLAATMTLALCALLLAQRDGATGAQRRNYMLLCWAGMALAVLSKGLVGIVLPGATLLLYSLAARDRTVWRRLHGGAGVALFCAIAVPWFLLMSLRNPEFLEFFFIREHFQRFASNVHLRAAPWHFYIPLLLAGSLPWLGVLPQSLRAGWSGATTGFQPGKLLLIWAVFIFCFFSVSKGKLPAYILPVFPALALLLGHYLANAPRRAIAMAAAVSACAGVIGLGVLWRHALPPDPAEWPVYDAFRPWLAGASALALAGGALAAWLSWRYRMVALLVLAGTGFAGGHVLLLGHETFGRHKAGVAHVPAIAAELGPHTPIYAVGAYEYVLPFYLRRTMIMVERAEDGMALGLQKEPQLWRPARDDFMREWRALRSRSDKALAIMPPEIYAALQKQEFPMRIVAQDNRRVIVANDAR